MQPCMQVRIARVVGWIFSQYMTSSLFRGWLKFHHDDGPFHTRITADLGSKDIARIVWKGRFELGELDMQSVPDGMVDDDSMHEGASDLTHSPQTRDARPSFSQRSCVCGMNTSCAV